MNFLNILFFLAVSLVLFQNCSESHNFQTEKNDVAQTSNSRWNYGESDNFEVSSDVEPKLLFYQAEKEINELNLQDIFTTKISFFTNYQSPAICFTKAGNMDRCQNLNNYIDLTLFMTEAPTKDGASSTFVLSEFDKILKSNFINLQIPLDISVFFISEYHNKPVKIKNFKLVSTTNYIPPTTNIGLCEATPRLVKILDWDQYKTCGVPVETRTIKQGDILSYKFIADKKFYPRGNSILFETTVYAGGSNRVDISISSCPGVFETSQSRCSFKNAKITSIYTSFDPSSPTHCILKDEEVYFLNIKVSDRYIEAAKIIATQQN